MTNKPVQNKIVKKRPVFPSCGMQASFDKIIKDNYMPKNKPEIVKIPPMNYVAVRGKGNPNVEGGDYQQAIRILYAVAYTLKMSYKTDYKIEGFFEYVVPPLEGFWWQGEQHPVDGEVRTDQAGRRENIKGIDYASRRNLEPMFIKRTILMCLKR